MTAPIEDIYGVGVDVRTAEPVVTVECDGGCGRGAEYVTDDRGPRIHACSWCRAIAPGATWRRVAMAERGRE